MTLTDARIREIEAAARDSRDGDWPATPWGLARLLAESSKSLLFIHAARGYVLWLCRELRQARETVGDCPTCGETVEARACL